MSTSTLIPQRVLFLLIRLKKWFLVCEINFSQNGIYCLMWLKLMTGFLMALYRILSQTTPVSVCLDSQGKTARWTSMSVCQLSVPETAPVETRSTALSVTAIPGLRMRTALVSLHLCISLHRHNHALKLGSLIAEVIIIVAS